MTDSENATPGEPAGSVTASADPLSAEPISALPISAQPQTVAVDDPTHLLPPVAPAPRPAPTGDRPETAATSAGSAASAGSATSAASDAPTTPAAPDPATPGSAAPAETPEATASETAPKVVARDEARAVRMITAVTVAAAIVVAGGATALALTWPGSGSRPPTGPTATAGAACLIGTWRSTQLVIGGIATTGDETLVFHDDGTGVDTLDHLTVTSADGHTHMYDGTVMFRYVAATSIVNTMAPAGTLVDRDLTAETTRTEAPAYAPKNFVCSPASLVLTNGGDTSRFTRS